MVFLKQQAHGVVELHRLIRPLCRVLCGGVALTLALSLPINWGKVGQAVIWTAAGVRQPQSALSALNGRLTAPAELSVTAASGRMTPPDSVPEKTTSAPEQTVSAVQTQSPPPEDGTGGKIYERKLDTGDKLLSGIASRNRSGKSVDIPAALKAALPQTFEQTDAPQVLIVHTHTTEGYMLYDAGYYNSSDRNRIIDDSRGVCAVGTAVAGALQQQGIKALHDTTVHDSPQYSGAYTRSAQTVQTYLDRYPSIKVVLDLHRDAIMQNDTDLAKPTVTVNGRKAAQMMIIAGVVSTNALPHPHWEQNFALAAQWQRALDKAAPDVMRPLSVVASRYNQHMSTGYLLVEVGSEGNTLAEAVYSGEILGTTLAQLLQPR